MYSATAGGVRSSAPRPVAILSRTWLDEVGFEIEAYDESLPQVIDPVLQWATFLDGSGQEQVNGVAVDREGFVYAAGFTSSANFPTAAPRDGALGGAIDGFVSKLSPDGTQLIWSTYPGGSPREEIRGPRIGSAGQESIAATD